MIKITDNIYAFIWNNPTINNCNTYFIDGRKKVIIDPGHYHLFGHVKEGLKDIGRSIDDIDMVIITHAHPDHMEGIKHFKDKLISIHRDEIKFLTDINPQYRNIVGLDEVYIPILLQEGELFVGGDKFTIIHTPGHSPGSICIYMKDYGVLFTGDLVFYRGIGRTDLPGGDPELLKKSINRLSELEVEYLLPGHGDIISGRYNILNNLNEVRNLWFPYL